NTEPLGKTALGQQQHGGQRHADQCLSHVPCLLGFFLSETRRAKVRPSPPVPLPTRGAYGRACLSGRLSRCSVSATKRTCFVSTVASPLPGTSTRSSSS